MSKVKNKTNFRVEVRPRNPGDFGLARIKLEQKEKEWFRDCEEIAAQIRRHVDGLPSYGDRGVTVEYDIESSCSFCGSGWSEDTDVHNGGFCKEDEKVFLEHEPQA